MGPQIFDSGVELVIVDGRPAIRGDCDISNAETVAAWLRGFTRRPLEVDLSGVTFFDASALRALLSVHHGSAGIRIVAPSRAVRRVLELTDTCRDFVDDSG
jgi:anti-anti-sigma factor